MIKNKLVKSLSVLMASAMVLTSGVPINVLANVNTDSEHSHTYSDNYESNENNHWRDFTCGCISDDDALGTPAENPTVEPHNWDMDNATVVAPTDDARGYTLATCKTCGYRTKINYTSHLGEHKWAKVSTVNEDGVDYDYYECLIDGCYEIKKEKKTSLGDVLTYGPNSGSYDFGINLYINITKNLSDYGWDAIYYIVQEDGKDIYSGYLTNEDKNTSFEETLGIESESHVYQLTIYPVIKNNNYYIPIEDVGDKTITENYQTSLNENHTWEIKYNDKQHYWGATCHPSITRDYENHTFELDNDTYKEATCYQDGYARYTCGFCGCEKEVITPKTDHDYSERTTINGHEVSVCSYCGKKKCVGEHDGKWIITKEATDTEDGIREKVCSICGEVLDTQTFKKDEDIELETPLVKIHDGNLTKTFGHFIFKINATVDNDATILYSSSNPNVATIDEDGIVTVQGVGTTTLTAKVNAIPGWTDAFDSITLTIKSDKLDHVHNFADYWSMDSTYHWHKCLNDDCDGTITDKAEHTVSGWIIDSNPTTTQNGSRHKECTVCGYITEQEDIPALTHTHVFSTDWSYDETYHWHDCLEDGCDGTVSEKTQHIPSDWIIDKNATETEEGSRHRECLTCHAVLVTEDIPKVTHTWSKDWTSNDTYHWHKCLDDNCDATSTAEEHTREVIVESAIGKYSDGVVVTRCSVCGAELERKVAPGFFTDASYEQLAKLIASNEANGIQTIFHVGSFEKDDIIPKKFLETIKGHDVDVELYFKTDLDEPDNMKGVVTIGFNGKDVKNPKDLKLGLSLFVNIDNNLSEEDASKFMNEDNAMIFALLSASSMNVHKMLYFTIGEHGTFDFPVTYSFRYFNGDTNKNISLFYLSDDNKLSVVDEKQNTDNISFTLNHASGYILAESDKSYADAMKEVDDNKNNSKDNNNDNNDNGNNSTVDNGSANNSGSNSVNGSNGNPTSDSSDGSATKKADSTNTVKTSDTNNVWIPIVITLIGFGAIVIGLKKKTFFNQINI